MRQKKKKRAHAIQNDGNRKNNVECPGITQNLKTLITKKNDGPRYEWFIGIVGWPVDGGWSYQIRRHVWLRVYPQPGVSWISQIDMYRVHGGMEVRSTWVDSTCTLHWYIIIITTILPYIHATIIVWLSRTTSNSSVLSVEVIIKKEREKRYTPSWSVHHGIHLAWPLVHVA